MQRPALVHEAYLRLANAHDVDWQDRAHFFALSAQNHASPSSSTLPVHVPAKRGGGATRVAHSSAVDLDQIPSPDSGVASSSLSALDDALESLAQIDPRRARVIELRFLGGLSIDETASVLRVSPQTVMRDWRLARAWIARELRAG